MSDYLQLSMLAAQGLQHLLELSVYKRCGGSQGSISIPHPLLPELDVGYAVVLDFVVLCQYLIHCYQNWMLGLLSSANTSSIVT